MPFPKTIPAITAAMLVASAAWAGEFDSAIPMREKGAVSYYVAGHIDGVGAVDFMVDTGSSYMTINEETLELLKLKQQTKYLRDLRGRLANGTELIVPIYAVGSVVIGDRCRFDNVEAAVFPGRTRHILGLSALSRATPFVFSMDPPELILSHCTDGPGQALAANAQKLPNKL